SSTPSSTAASGGASFAFITFESIGRCGRRTLGRGVANTETVELEPCESVVTTLLQIPKRLRARGEKLVVREVGDSPPGEKLDEERIRGPPLECAAHSARIVRPRPAQGQIQPEKRQGRDEGDGEREQDAEVLRGVAAVASAHLGAPSRLRDLVGDARHLV